LNSLSDFVSVLLYKEEMGSTARALSESFLGKGCLECARILSLILN